MEGWRHYILRLGTVNGMTLLPVRAVPEESSLPRPSVAAHLTATSSLLLTWHGQQGSLRCLGLHACVLHACHMCMRSYANRRELATELAREVLPQLQGTGTKLLLISIGTPERGREFAAKTGFPEELLLADPESETYAAVGHVT